MVDTHKPVIFCVKCSQTMIAGMVDPTSEFKKVMKCILNSIGNVEPGLPAENVP